MDRIKVRRGVMYLFYLLLWFQESDAELFLVGIGHPRDEAFIELYTSTAISNLKQYKIRSESFEHVFEEVPVPAGTTIIVTALKDGYNVYGFLGIPNSQQFVYEDDNVKFHGKDGIVLQKDDNDVDIFGSTNVKNACKVDHGNYKECPFEDGWARRKDGVLGKCTSLLSIIFTCIHTYTFISI